MLNPPPIRARRVEDDPPAIPPPPIDPMTLPGVSTLGARLDLWLVLLVGVIGPFLPSVFALAGQLPVVASAGQDSAMLLTVGKWSEALIVLTLLLYLMQRHAVPARSFGLHGDAVVSQQLASVPIILIACYAVMMALGLMVSAVFPERLGAEAAQKLEFSSQLPEDLLGSAMLMLPVVLHEEVLFRGLLLPYLRRLTGSWQSAVLVSAVVFGSLHFTQGPMAMVQVTGVGVVLSIAFIKTRSLLAVIVTHFVFNMLQIQLASWMRDQLEAAGGIEQFI